MRAKNRMFCVVFHIFFVKNELLKQMVHIIPTLMLVVFMAVIAPAQNIPFHGKFGHYTTKNGLSQNDVRCIFQDSYGFIWIGTYGGLNRFDGYSFISYQKDVNGNGVSSNLISVITEDNRGNLWIGSDDHGITFFDRNTEKFLSISNDHEHPQLLSGNHILSILIDRNDIIWAGTIHGLDKIMFNYKTHEYNIEHLSASEKDPNSISHNSVNSIYEDNFGNLWFGTGNGLNRYIHSEKGAPQFIRYNQKRKTAVRNIAQNDTSLLISYQGEIVSLPYREINNNNPTFITIKYIPSTDLISDRSNNIWSVNSKGVHVYYNEHGTIKAHHFKSDWSDPNSINSNIISSILEDRSGIIWIGTNGGGVNVYNPNKKSFKIAKRSVDPGSLSYNKIRSLTEDSKGNLWVGTEGGGLNMLPAAEKHNYNHGFIHFATNPNTENFVYDIEEGLFKNRDRIFIGTGYSANLEVLDLKSNGQYERNTFQGLKPTSAVFTIKQDTDSILWIGTYNNGLFRIFLDDNGKYVSSDHFKHLPGDDNSLSSDVIRSIEEDHQGNLWIGTDDGLNKVLNTERSSGPIHFIKYLHEDDNHSSLSYDYVLPILVSKDGNIWIGTLGGGINKVIPGRDPAKDTFEWINTNNGLPNDIIKSIEEDEKGNLWISSNKGLSRYNPLTGAITNFGTSDGLQDLEFSEIASQRRKDGEMVFGGVNGLNVFYPNEILQDTSRSIIVFTELQILNRTIKTGEKRNRRVILNKNINNLKKLKLNFDENSFSLSFAALNYAAPEKNQYEYKLEGFDQEWIPTTAQNRIAKYTNMSPGTYTLLVKASNSDGVWNDTPISLTILINPPFWRSNIALIIYVVLLLVGLWFLRKFTLITYTRKNDLLVEHLEKEKFEELSKMKLQFFTNISHEFRTPLTLIIGLAERLRKTPDVKNENEKSGYYDKIYRNAQILLNLINQLLDFRKVEHGKMKVKVVFGDIGRYVQDLCENFVELARRKNIDFNFICESKIEGYYDPDIIERIVFNLLSNAIKYTDEDGEITTSLEVSGEKVTLEVTDTGIGIDKEIQNNIFDRFSNSDKKRERSSGIGLSFTKTLVELYHGSISFHSTKHVGTTFTVIFPFGKQAFKNDNFFEEAPAPNETRRDLSWLLDKDYDKSKADDSRKGGKEYNVLLVEDNDDILFYLSEQFQDKYNIYTAKNGKIALDLCLKEHVDLVVSDVMMPEMDGLEFCEQLKKDDRINHIPIILLTAKNSTDNKVKGYEKGADAYIGKPFDMLELEARMESLISSRKKILAKLRKNIQLEPSEIEVTSLDEKFLKRVISFIEENISTTEFTVEMLAHECGMSQLHLNKKLKVLVGQTANAFIRSMRLKRAAQLLSKNRYSVNEVMYECGFIDAKYFRTCFKKEFGIPPSEYQKANKEVSLE